MVMSTQEFDLRLRLECSDLMLTRGQLFKFNKVWTFWGRVREKVQKAF